MSIIAAEILKEAIGPVASGPAGFGVNYKIENDANIDASTTGVTAKLDETSLTSARAQNESGINKQVAATLDPKIQHQSNQMTSMMSRNEQSDSRYGSLFSKRGLETSVNRSLTPTPRFGARPSNHRTVMPQNVLSKNPALRIKQRHLLRLRRTFDEIAGQKSKTVAINPQNLPKQAMAKMVNAALEKGLEMTPLGPIVQAAKLAGLMPKMGAKAAPAPKKRQWAMINPELIPSGWATD